MATSAIQDPQVRKILTSPRADSGWEQDLKRFESGDSSLTRRNARESSIRGIQRLLIFLGYSTSSTGAFAVDGDFGRGTNRGIAQFMFDHKLTSTVNRSILTYDCTWQTAKANIVAIPEVKLTVNALNKMIDIAKANIDANNVMCGSFKEALFHLDAVDNRMGYSCRDILNRYGNLVERAANRLNMEKGIAIRPEWILSIIRQETAGVVRPRFEQHLLTRLNNRASHVPLDELRFQSMSFGLGQILGDNFKRVGAQSAKAMFTSPLHEQVYFVARFLAPKQDQVTKSNPNDADFRAVAKFYNGPGYAKHHYHESIANWFREFRTLLG